MKKIINMLLAISLVLGPVCIFSSATEVNVLNGDELAAAFAQAKDGDTIILPDGTIRISEGLTLSGKNNITVTSAGETTITCAQKVTG